MKALAIVAHPDDAEIGCGGTTARWAERGDEVVWGSTTIGDTGHHAIGGIELARRRHLEGGIE